MKHNKLRARIIEKYGNVKRFCDEFGISESAMSSRLNGTSAFRVTEAKRICEFLDIPGESVWQYFF